MSPRARQAKGKARLNAYEQLLAEDTAQKVDTVEIYIPPGPRLGDIVVEARGLKKAYGDTVLFDDLTFTLPRGGIVGVIGPNGAGKTTTFKLITGEEKPDAGTHSARRDGAGRLRRSVPRRSTPNKSVFDEITGGVDELEMGKKKVASRAYVSWFNFKGAQQQRKVGTLSGGERNRVHLAKLLRKGSNLLLLDEPTNDLDVDTLRALEEALLNYAGCAVVISHDRWFLDRIATHILAFEGDSETVWFEGNYQDYEADRKRRLGAAGRSTASHQVPKADAIVVRARHHETRSSESSVARSDWPEPPGRVDAHLQGDQRRARRQEGLQAGSQLTLRVGPRASHRDLRRRIPARDCRQQLRACFPAKCDAKTIPALADWYKHELPKALEKVLTLDGPHLRRSVEALAA